MKHAGLWEGGKWDPIIELVEVDGSVFALDGWNGEKYTNCWKCVDEWTVDPEQPGRFATKPIYRFQVDEIDLDGLEENSEEWENAVEIVDYDVGEKE